MLPTFVVIGTMKGGTSALHSYLRKHPEICMSETKETNYFIAERNFPRGQAWYESHFARKAARERGESSPNYTKLPRFGGVPARMHATIPQAKLIYLVRDPIERMVSQYGHNVAKGSEPQSLDDALLTDNDGRYTIPSQYHTQLAAFLEFFPREQVLVLASEELRSSRRKALARVFEFLGVDPAFDSPAFHTEVHRTASKFAPTGTLARLMTPLRTLARGRLPRKSTAQAAPAMKLGPAARSDLAARLKEEIDAFRTLTGQRFEQWSV